MILPLHDERPDVALNLPVERLPRYASGETGTAPFHTRRYR
jgi:hypothetical protein